MAKTLDFLEFTPRVTVFYQATRCMVAMLSRLRTRPRNTKLFILADHLRQTLREIAPGWPPEDFDDEEQFSIAFEKATRGWCGWPDDIVKTFLTASLGLLRTTESVPVQNPSRDLLDDLTEIMVPLAKVADDACAMFQEIFRGGVIAENARIESVKSRKAKANETAAELQAKANEIWERNPDFSIRKVAAAIANQVPGDREHRKKLAERIRKKLSP